MKRSVQTIEVNAYRSFLRTDLRLDGSPWSPRHPEIATTPVCNYFRSAGRNWTATTLFDRKGFYINGPAILETSVETWGCLRVLGSEQIVRENIAHLGPGDHDVVPTSRRNTHQDVIGRGPDDIFLLKLAL
jgi:hypothetical protein